MAATETQLDTPFRRAMLYVVEQLGEVGVMKLEKILYLADLEYFHRRGRKITGAKWVRQRLGPVAKTVLPSTRMMRDHEVTVTERRVAGGHASLIYRPGMAPRFRPNLEDDERETLDRIIELTRDLTAADAAKLTYQTTPMLARLQVEAAEGRELWDETLVFARSDREMARVSRRVPRASIDRRRTFKQAELGRVADLNEAAIARSAER